MRRRLHRCVLAWLSTAALLLAAPGSHAANLPSGFVDRPALAGLESPATFAFSPDGRMFVAERIAGRLLVAKYDAPSELWVLEPEPFYVFDIPKDSSGVPERHRSSGVRDIAFDPSFDTNGYLYVFYMKNNPRQNRVVRISASAGNPDVADPASETLLIDLPFNASGASGSHNGGGMEFGGDGHLYITTGDGWSGGNPVQRLDTFTGKVLRIQTNGAIPTDNPFYTQASGSYRAIYSLGLRNPFSLSVDPTSGTVYVNEAIGSQKADVFAVEAGANFQHQGYGGIGTAVTRWARLSDAGGKLITGGAWYPESGPFPSEYWGSYFSALWGSNSSSPGHINRLLSNVDPTAVGFASGVGEDDGSGQTLKPVLTRVGPEGDLYYLLTNYETDDGRVRRITWTGEDSAATPVLDPDGGSFDPDVTVIMTSTTPTAEVRYTTDGSEPDETSTLYAAPVTFTESLVVKARAFAEGLQPSGTAQGVYLIGGQTNVPPIAVAGPDQIVEVGTLVTLNGSASSDPDGDDASLVEEWIQTSGPPADLLGSDDSVAFFTPSEVGLYEFEITVDDGFDTDSDRVLVDAVVCSGDIRQGLVAHWTFDEGVGSTVFDSTGSGLSGELTNTSWEVDTPDDSNSSLGFDGVTSAVDLGGLDVAGSAVSFSLWMKAASFDTMDARLISKASGVQDQDHFWMLSTLTSGGGHVLRLRLRTSSSTSVLLGSAPLAQDTWTHVAATYDGATMRLWQDGVQVGTLAKSGPLDTDPAIQAAIGNQPQSLDRPFDGLLDDVRIYDRALDESEIRKIIAGVGNCGPIFDDGFESGGTNSWSE